MSGVSQKAYSNCFCTLQKIDCFILWYQFDWGQKKVENYRNFFCQHEAEYTNERDLFQLEDELKSIGLNARKMAREISLNSKMAMRGKFKQNKIKEANIGMDSGFIAYFLIALYTLRKHYKMSVNDCQKFYGHMKECIENFKYGMDDNFLKEFLKDQFGYEDFIDVTEEKKGDRNERV